MSNVSNTKTKETTILFSTLTIDQVKRIALANTGRLDEKYIAIIFDSIADIYQFGHYLSDKAFETLACNNDRISKEIQDKVSFIFYYDTAGGLCFES